MLYTLLCNNNVKFINKFNNATFQFKKDYEDNYNYADVLLKNFNIFFDEKSEYYEGENELNYKLNNFASVFVKDFKLLDFKLKIINRYETGKYVFIITDNENQFNIEAEYLFKGHEHHDYLECCQFLADLIIMNIYNVVVE
ncbi:hypothetical protein O1O32_001115 [Campylobacter jejuni]|nr:hypothetical protein [Campylobacter jejuni]